MDFVEVLIAGIRWLLGDVTHIVGLVLLLFVVATVWERSRRRGTTGNSS